MKKTKYYTHEEMHRKWMKDPEFRREYEKLEPEFRIASALIEARIKGKMTQAELAEKAKTGQAVISRLENMNARPSLSLIQRVAEALGLRVDLRLLPQ
jgi:ribosome-binding protein aMBF1 (putative translation factor)